MRQERSRVGRETDRRRDYTPAMPLYEVHTDGQLQPHLEKEWLLTNGIGGFASSTVVGCNTRRYHGLLVAATLPPLGRVMALNRVGEVLRIDGREPLLELAVNQFGERFHPRGEQYLRRFEMDDFVRWEYEVEGVRIVKELRFEWMRNAITVRYEIDPRSHARVELDLLPFVSMRDFHATRKATEGPLHVAGEGRSLRVAERDVELLIESDAGELVRSADWWYGHTYRVETERGLDDTEDLFCPGRYRFETDRPAAFTLRVAARTLTKQPPAGGDPAPRMLAGPGFEREVTPTVRKLMRAADDFIVPRRAPDGSAGTTILAGYPWFGDWGRDTMIALPGLLLHTGKYEQARQVLGVFAKYVSEGMIPNLFDDYSNEPHYNTVDASLWFVHAVHEYLRLSKDRDAYEQTLYPACMAIIEGYRQGTRFKIAMDEADGLINQGDAHTQLTWMDAKCGGVAFTPRHGKAVEINALWYNALRLLRQEELAEKVAASFRKTFWINPFRGLYDVVNEQGQDTTLRPNQIFAVSLPHSPLTREQQSAVVEVVRRELLTPYGLRSLARGEACYRGRYAGPQMQRDEAYHNGTVWAWLIGPFLEAYLKVNDRSPEAVRQARQWLQPLIDHLNGEGCIGQISEVFEGDLPHCPGGCCAQAWSVAEVLRLAVELGL